MNAKDAIMQIRALFEDMPQVEAPAPMEAPIEEVPVTFAEYSLMDGTKVMISELAIGGEVTLADGTPAEKMADEIAALVSENENLKTQVAQLEAKVKNGFSQVAELIEALTKTPNAEPIAQPRNNFGSNVTTHSMKYDRIEKFRNALLNK